jgi:hypothetical protein
VLQRGRWGPVAREVASPPGETSGPACGKMGPVRSAVHEEVAAG